MTILYLALLFLVTAGIIRVLVTPSKNVFHLIAEIFWLDFLFNLAWVLFDNIFEN